MATKRRDGTGQRNRPGSKVKPGREVEPAVPSSDQDRDDISRRGGDGCVETAVRSDVRSLCGSFPGGAKPEHLATLARLPEGVPADPDGSRLTVVREVGDIIKDVINRGDVALRELALRLDAVTLNDIEVPRADCERALRQLEPSVRSALERAERNIASFHRATKPSSLSVEVEPGVRVSQQWDPLDSVGIYAPGGRAAYPSSVLMGVVPAKVAGVKEVIVCSPPRPDGRPPRAVMAACALAGADRLFALGGAGAIGAMAHGTKTVPQVLAIVGPGNSWVTEAKRQVQGKVRIDSLAGPSEVLVIADDTADPRLVALELVAQAEHDPQAASVLVAISTDLAAAVDKELPSLIAAAERREIIATALATKGAILTAESMTEALGFANWYAPEHLVVIARNAETAIMNGRPRAGSVFVGSHSSVSFGDYLTGANHVLPTGRRAKMESGLSTRDFMRSWTVQVLSRDGAAGLAADTAILAEAEGLPAHAEAARARAGHGSRPGPRPRSTRPRLVERTERRKTHG